MAARKNKVKLTESWKDGIRASVLMRRLSDCAEGKVEMNNVQVKAAQVVLAKIVPDLARTELTGKDGGAIIVHAKESDEQL